MIFLRKPKIAMKTHQSLQLASCILVCAALATGCAGTKNADTVTYDLGSLGPATPPSRFMGAAYSDIVAPATGPITVADVTSAAWLDNQTMQYRLSYTNDQQPRPYATSRWSMPPPQLLSQRIKARLAQSGRVVLSGADGAINIPTLRVEVEDFSQRFTSYAESTVKVAVRASVFNGRLLVAQKHFEREQPAPTPDAAGGASGLASATDGLISDMTTWLASLSTKK